MISNLILILHLLIAILKGTVTHAYWFCLEKLLCTDSECFSCHQKTNLLYTKLRCLPYPQTSITVLLLWFLEMISSFSSSKLRQPLSKLLSLTQTIQTTQNTFASRANFLAKHTQHSFFVFISLAQVWWSVHPNWFAYQCVCEVPSASSYQSLNHSVKFSSFLGLDHLRLAKQNSFSPLYIIQEVESLMSLKSQLLLALTSLLIFSCWNWSVL
jgi:hypothetical protein